MVLAGSGGGAGEKSKASGEISELKVQERRYLGDIGMAKILGREVPAAWGCRCK